MMENLYEKYSKKKVYIGIAIFLIIFHIITLFIIYKRETSFTIDGQKFKYISDKGDTILFQDSEGNMVTVIITDFKNSYNLFKLGDKYEVEYKDGIIKVDSSDWFDEGTLMILSDGTEYIQEGLFFHFGYEVSDTRPFDVQLVNNINSTYEFAKENDLFAIPFITSILIFIALANIIYPEEMWRFDHLFTVRGGEPTEFAIFMSKLGGVLILLMVLFGPSLIIIK